MRALPATSRWSVVLLSSLTSAVSAQTLNVDAINGTVVLSGGFSPDPHVTEVVPGGETAAQILGDGCAGFIYSSQPDLKLELRDPSTQLGIFALADVDVTLVVNGPSGDWVCNDDSEELGDGSPGLTFMDPEEGIYDVWVGTFDRMDPADAGTAQLVITEWPAEAWFALELGGASASKDDEIDFGDDLSKWANDGECDDPRFAGAGAADTLLEADRFHDATDCRTLYERGEIQLSDPTGATSETSSNVQRGRLESSDPVLEGNGYVDRYTYRGTAGTVAVFDLQSAEFDTFLALITPSGQRLTNDDYDGSQQRSLLTLNLTESGEYQVEVTSYAEGETGEYTLTLAGDLAAPQTAAQEFQGRLERSDTTFNSGEYFDTWTFDGVPGETVTIDLYSDDFDTYLVLEGPDGNSEANDDADDGINHSQIVRQLSALGAYQVRVTSYAAGETGAYRLSIAQSVTDQTAAVRDSITMDIGERLSGRLEDGDQQAQDNSFEDVYVFSADAGQLVAIDLTSNNFDTYLSLVTPRGEVITNDDFDSRTDLSRIELALPESGRYRILAGSYEVGATGGYTLSLERGNSADIAAQSARSSGGQIFGIFAGIADYPGEEGDLALTDQDALRARDALIEGVGMSAQNAYTLLNEDATNAHFRDALSAIGSQAGSDDMVVIFYSGHGNRVPRPDGPDSRDPDGLDETIELYDGSLLDDELAELLDGINAGTVLLVFDSCFSGGFAKDVVSAPGRMGLFSSEEDVTSQVAFKFQAGGYLAAFFDEALRGGFADADGDKELTAIELSQYLHDRYRADVKSFGADEYVRTSGPSASYQHLVVDRGGVAPYNVLFRH